MEEVGAGQRADLRFLALAVVVAENDLTATAPAPPL